MIHEDVHTLMNLYGINSKKKILIFFSILLKFLCKIMIIKDIDKSLSIIKQIIRNH